MVVRQLRPDDIYQLYPMAEEHETDLDGGHFEEHVAALMENATGLFVGVFDGPLLIATAAGVLGQDVFSGHVGLYGLWWYVAPHRRGGTVALRALRGLFRRARTMGARTAEMGVQVSGNERVGEIYARMGLTPRTTSYIGELGKCLQQ